MGAAELKILQTSQMNGRWAFVVATTANQQPFVSDQLLSVDTPSYFARSWTITLCAFNYQGGGLPLGNSQPTDNQVVAACRAKAKVSWGVEGASETDVILDYPCKGLVFQVQAANIRLSLFTEGAIPNGSAPPLFAGFMSPFQRFTPVVHNPTLTTSLNLIGPAATALFPVPARAVAYRFFTQVPPVAGDNLQFDQRQENGATIVQFDAAYPQTAGISAEQLQSNRAAFMPLNPVTQFVTCLNSAAAARSVGLQWLLDMG